jgi:hypothetical protein
VIGKLFAELYHLGFTPWSNLTAEEHFLSLRTLLLHMYSAAALGALAKYQCKDYGELRRVQKG